MLLRDQSWDSLKIMSQWFCIASGKRAEPRKVLVPEIGEQFFLVAISIQSTEQE